MRHEMLTQRARFCIGVMAKKGTLSQHFVTHVVPPLGSHHMIMNVIKNNVFTINFWGKLLGLKFTPYLHSQKCGPVK